MKTIKIKGFQSHLFKEGQGYNVIYGNYEELNRPVNGNYYNATGSNKKLYVHFNFFENYLGNLGTRNLNNQKEIDIFEEKSDYLINPFVEKQNKYTDLKKNTSIYTKNYGHASKNLLTEERKFEPFKDNKVFSIKEYVSLTEQELLSFTYPIEFNVQDNYKKSCKIDIFDSLEKLKLSSLGVDRLRGVRGFALKNSIDANGKCIEINDYYVKSNNKNNYFEDGVLKNYIFNKNKRTIVKKVIVTFNSQTEENETQVTYLDDTVINKEPRYSNLNNVYIKPFVDSSYKENSSRVKNDPQFFINKLSNDDLNNILLSNRSKYNYLEEEKIYTARGRSIDLSNSIGLDSIVYYESLD